MSNTGEKGWFKLSPSTLMTRTEVDENSKSVSTG